MKKQNLSQEEIKILKQLVKQLKEEERDKAGLEEESEKAIKQNLCKKGSRVKVNSWIISMMARSYGKEGNCK